MIERIMNLKMVKLLFFLMEDFEETDFFGNLHPDVILPAEGLFSRCCSF